jgi:hypothetical protein
MDARRGFVLAAALWAAFGLVGGSEVTAAGRGDVRRVVYYGQFDQPEVEPTAIYAAANCSPRYVDLVWKDWGAKQTTATGRYVCDCPMCGPTREEAPATVTLSDPIRCGRKGFDAYRNRAVTITRADGTISRSGAGSTGYWAFCK